MEIALLIVFHFLLPPFNIIISFMICHLRLHSIKLHLAKEGIRAQVLSFSKF